MPKHADSGLCPKSYRTPTAIEFFRTIQSHSHLAFSQVESVGKRDFSVQSSVVLRVSVVDLLKETPTTETNSPTDS